MSRPDGPKANADMRQHEGGPVSRGWNAQQMAARVAAALPDGAIVNLGVGLPVAVADHIPAGRTIFFHSENGIIGLGAAPDPGHEDPDVVNAAKEPATLIAGASIVHHADSFSLIRGGRLDCSILGGLQVASNGDVANWKLPNQKGGGGVGGAMDLAVGARKVYVMMKHREKNGAPKLLTRCDYPLTAVATVSLVFTDLGVFRCRGAAFEVVELAPGITRDEVAAATGAPLDFAAMEA